LLILLAFRYLESALWLTTQPSMATLRDDDSDNSEDESEDDNESTVRPLKMERVN